MPVPRRPFLPDRLQPRPPVVPVDVGQAEVDSVSFGDLVRMVGESIADAQRRLDETSAGLVRELAETKVEIVPSITETIAEDGTVTAQPAPVREVSLLELGISPTFYQFSQATVEVSMDLKVAEVTDTQTNTKDKRLFAGTRELRSERKLNRDVSVSSKLTATLVPVPSPLRLDPVRTTTTPGG